MVLHLCIHGRITTSADVAHCQGVGKQFYVNAFEVISYDSKSQFVPICILHSVGTECEELLKKVFAPVRDL